MSLFWLLIFTSPKKATSDLLFSCFSTLIIRSKNLFRPLAVPMWSKLYQRSCPHSKCKIFNLLSSAFLYVIYFFQSVWISMARLSRAFQQTWDQVIQTGPWKKLHKKKMRGKEDPSKNTCKGLFHLSETAFCSPFASSGSILSTPLNQEQTTKKELTSFLSSWLAPFSRSSLTISACPRWLASMRAVRSYLSTASIFPRSIFSNNSLAILTCPWSEATINGVRLYP